MARYDNEDIDAHLDRFPFSCGAVCLGEFGGGEGGQYEDEDDYEQIDPDVLMSYLKASKRYNDPKIIFAVTTSNQPWAGEMLKKFGFYTSKTVGSTSGGRTIQGWFLPIHEFDPDKVIL